MIQQADLKKLNAKLNKIGEKLSESIVEIPKEITRELAIGANDIRTTIIMGMRNTKRAPWWYWRSKGRKLKKSGKGFLKSAKRHYPSAPGEYPAIDSGELVSRIAFDVRDMEIEVGALAGAPYAEWLEGGTERMFETKNFGTIKIKNMEPRPWLGPSVVKHQEEIVERVGEGAFEILGDAFKP